MTDTETQTQTQTYTYDELSPAAKNKALTKYGEPEYQWWDDVYDNARKDGWQYGFEVDDIRFSGFASQGDGASWTGRVRVVPYLDHKLKDPDALPPPLFGQYTLLREMAENDYVISTIDVTRGGGMYVHENTMLCDSHFTDYGDVDPEYYGDNETLTTGVLKGARMRDLLSAYDFGTVLNSLIDDVQEAARSYARKIYGDLEREYDWLTSEENFRELAEINNWRFDASGEMV